MSPKTRLFTLLAGAAALAGLSYGFGRFALKPRPLGALSQRTPTANALLPDTERGRPEAWESELLSQNTTPDALDLALDLDGVFDAPPADETGITVRPSDRVPVALNADDGATEPRRTRAQLAVASDSIRAQLQ